MTRWKSSLWLLAALFVLSFAGSVAAQDPAERLKAFTEAQRAEEAARAAQEEQAAQAAAADAAAANFEGPRLPSGQTLGALERLENLSPEVAASYLAALKAQYDYKNEGFDHRVNVFAWQYYSSIMIFAMVVSLVSAGFYFSWVQFKRDMKGAADPEATQLELSTQGVKIQSSILGVIILVVSLAFLYLYLVHVYPISEIL